MDARASCPQCDSPVPRARAVCARCGFALTDERIAGRRPREIRKRRNRRRARRPRPVPVAAAGLAAGVAALALFGAPDLLRPSSDALPAAEVERRLADRYPHLRRADAAVIACPERAIQAGGEARCWVLARVGLQRSVIVRLSERGNEVEIDD